LKDVFPEKSDNWIIELFFYINKVTERVSKIFTKEPELNEKYDIKSIKFQMKPLTWGFYVELNKKCARNGNLNDIDQLLMKEKKLVDGILNWNIVDKNGNVVEINKENIFNLHPLIAERLIEEYDGLSYVTRSEKKAIVLNVNKYYLSAVAGTGAVDPPFEVIELSLIEKFGWTPEDINKMPYKKLQELFLVLNQREVSSNSARQLKK
jgi:hypothetical protein